ncbi:unnamed protein product [Cutaneotrichosporon oleaginosum]
MIANNTVRHAINSACYVLIVTRCAPASLSLASMNLLTGSLSITLSTISYLLWTTEEFINQMFGAAAFHACHVHSLRPKGSHMKYDYETRRCPGGGMELELRNVTFSYPGADKRKPSLKNVSLRIAPGETVAIVGSNGSGKSTLLKVLLGLYDGHEGLHGDVHVNNTHISDYDMRGIYAPTAVVMQDFQRYSLTLRENVGLGSTSLLHDDEALKKALERGGASAVAKQIGLDAVLIPYHNPYKGLSPRRPAPHPSQGWMRK